MTGPVLVTGATGFLGGHVARTFAADGIEVRGLGRDSGRGTALERHGIRFAPVDLADRPGLAAMCRNVDTVVHAAALSTAWAPAAAYRRANVAGTAAVLEAARGAGVRRFIHVSTPAVLSRFADQLDLAEDEPVPARHTSRYGESKAAAERIVGGAHGIETVIVRPKAIYGPGDTALLPRLVDAAARGRLRIVGDGATVTHLTHVSDVVRAIRLVADADRPALLYHVAGPEPARLWDAIGDLAERLGFDRPSQRVPVGRAMRAASVLEAAWRTLRLRGEPLLTRYKVAVLAYSQTLDITRARRELGFDPQVSIAEGLDEVVAGSAGAPARRRPAPRPDRAPMAAAARVSFALAGTVHPPAAAVRGPSPGRTVMPVLVGVIRHPTRGVVLFDTGYGAAAPGEGAVLWAGYRWLLGSRPASLAAALREAGATVDEVAAVVLSHFDPDHCGGLGEVPAADVFCSAPAWDDVAGHRAGSLRRRIAPGSLPADLAARIRLLDVPADGEPLDLFEDGTIEVVALDGHTPGHIGIRVADPGGRRYLLCGDAAMTLGQLEAGSPFAASLVDRDRAAASRTRTSLRAAMRADPGLVVVPSHCPDVADRLVGPGWRSPPSAGAGPGQVTG